MGRVRRMVREAAVVPFSLPFPFKCALRPQPLVPFSLPFPFEYLPKCCLLSKSIALLSHFKCIFMKVGIVVVVHVLTVGEC